MIERLADNQEPFLFVPEHWQEEIHKPDWYMTITEEFQALVRRAHEESEEKEKQVKEEAYRFIEMHLAQGDIELGKAGPDWDAERKPIDSIVIHHTSEPSGLSWQKISAIQLLNIYAPHYAAQTRAGGELKGQPIFSNHFRDGQQIFYSYHRLVRENGEVEHLLPDDQIGWQAGNWDVNCRSAAICLDGDYEDSEPSDNMLDVVAEVIKTRYPQVDPSRIFGHSEINPKTICPGKSFNEIWKPSLINKLK